MILLFDNLIATLIVMALFMSLVMTQLRVQEAGISQVSSHSAKTKALSFGQWLDEDIVSLGENVVSNDARFDNPSVDSFTVYTLDGGTPQPKTIRYTTEWRFYSDRRVPSGSKERMATRYVLVEQPEPHEVDLDGFTYTRPLFQLERSTTGWKNVDPTTDTAAFTEADFGEDGRSVSTLSLFNIQLVDKQGEVFAADDPLAPARASYIRVDFSMVPEFELKRGYLRELYWTTTLKVRPFWS